MTSGDPTAGATPVAKRVVIVGGVAGGMSTATRLRRLDADGEIIVLERSGHVSFANCGLPYFVGGLIEEEDDLTLQTPEQLFARFRLDVRVNSEVVAIDRAAHTVTTRSTLTGAETVVGYDKLVLSMGAAPVRPPIPGYDRVRTLRTVEDAARLASDVGVAPTTAVVIGAGFIGLEMAENLVAQGIDVTIVEATPQVLPPLDPELAILVADELVAHGVHVETGATVLSRRDARSRSPTGGCSPPTSSSAPSACGPTSPWPQRPAWSWARAAASPSTTANQTNDPDIYAVGDAVEKPDAVSHATSLIALANVANRQGRRVADHIAGRPSHPVGSLGTAIVKVFDLVAATVGWSERRLRAAGRPYRAIHSHPFDHATYYPGATRMAAKLIFDPDDGTILGAQIVGRNGVDKRIDVIATAMAGGHDRRPPGRPRAGLRPAVLLGQGPRQPARLHGGERAERRLRRRRPERARRARRRTGGPSSTCAPPRSTPTEPSRARSTCPSTRSATTSTRSATGAGRRVLRGGPARPHRHRPDARARDQGPQPRRRLPDVDRHGPDRRGGPRVRRHRRPDQPLAEHTAYLGVW